MNKIYSFIIVFLFLAAFNYAQEKLGAEITLTETTSIADILDNPSEYVGKKVLVEGEVLDVCKMAGCWMELSGEDGKKIKIKVKDGDIVFPVEAIGKKAKAEGEVYEIKMDQDKAIAYYEHLAEENETEFDPATVTGPVTLYQIKGSGAVVEMEKTIKETEVE